MIRKLLIANRGEIAVRIVRACAEMGIRSVAIYSEADKNALHVKKADEAYRISDDPLSGYLDPRRVANLAASVGCDAVHPGYGFLSENPRLAGRCAWNGIHFVGPPASLIQLMGDKVMARAAMQKAGIPVIPGSDGSVADIDSAIACAEAIGYPVMLKATSGGGGRGIRRCENAAEVQTQFERVRSEAKKAFGRAEIFIEKCIVNPLHIEVQILADRHGNVVHLFERDCSIQRRNQKLIEIAPSPQLAPELRERICNYALAAARDVGYFNAGTVEFLVDAAGEVYFMEMNTRLQVEHTITEQVTGIDIVQEQIRIAQGEQLSVTQADINFRGYAMEFRINAEDPQKNFSPSFGRITRYYAPGGPGVRMDSAIYTGYSIPPYYDSMCGKLIVWALDWSQLIERGKRALSDMMLSGIKTTVPYYQRILDNPQFKQACFNTAFVEDNPQLLDYKVQVPREHITVVLSAAFMATRQLRQAAVNEAASTH